MRRKAMKDFGQQLIDGTSYIIAQGVPDGVDDEGVCEEHLLAITRLAAEFAGVPIEAAISEAVLSDDLSEVSDLAIATIAQMPPDRVGAFLLSEEVSNVLNFCENGEDRPLLVALEAADPEAVARYLWRETKSCGWAESRPESLDIAWFLEPGTRVMPTDPAGRRAYWWMVARLIWGMQCGHLETMPRLIEGLRALLKSRS